LVLGARIFAEFDLLIGDLRENIVRPHGFFGAIVPIGLVPRQNSTGGKERLGHISKAGNR
jgi:hypothetical protein